MIVIMFVVITIIVVTIISITTVNIIIVTITVSLRSLWGRKLTESAFKRRIAEKIEYLGIRSPPCLGFKS